MAVVSRSDGKPWNADLDPKRVEDAETRAASLRVEAAEHRRTAIQLEDQAALIERTWGLDTHVP